MKLDELKQLYEKSTQGEWKADIINIGRQLFGISNCDKAIVMAPTQDDAVFIAAIHNAMPEILAKIERPVPEGDYDAAIEWLKVRQKVHTHLSNNPNKGTDYYNLAIQALRQMKQEPCQWCADAEKYMTWVVYEKNGQRYTGKPEFCPCCGRRLSAPPEKG